MRERASRRPSVRTRISCDRTNGYNVKAGMHHYDWCPFCGHRAAGDDHDILVTAPE